MIYVLPSPATTAHTPPEPAPPPPLHQPPSINFNHVDIRRQDPQRHQHQQGFDVITPPEHQTVYVLPSTTTISTTTTN